MSCASRAGSETCLLACWEHGNCPGTSASNPLPTPCLGQWLGRKRSKVNMAGMSEGFKVEIIFANSDGHTVKIQTFTDA